MERPPPTNRWNLTQKAPRERATPPRDFGGQCFDVPIITWRALVARALTKTASGKSIWIRFESSARNGTFRLVR